MLLWSDEVVVFSVADKVLLPLPLYRIEGESHFFLSGHGTSHNLRRMVWAWGDIKLLIEEE
jgi:hypothetical protein